MARGSVQDERRLAVADLGSNSFRLVVFRYEPAGPWQLTDEIREAARLSAGAENGELAEPAIERACRAAGLFGAFCRGSGIDDVDAVATSAVREAGNRDAVVQALAAEAGFPVRVVSAREEAYYAYLGIVNSMATRDFAFLDVGGGSVQLARVVDRKLDQSLSEPLGAVRMTEAFLAGETATRRQVKALRRHVATRLAGASWLREPVSAIGVGGTVRTLAAIAQRRSGYPLAEVHGYRLDRQELGTIVDELTRLSVRQRRRIPGLKADRADILLAGAVVVECALDALGAPALEVCAQGLREGVFYERYLAPADPPLVPDVRRASVRNLAGLYRVEQPHAARVAQLALDVFDGAARLGLHAADPAERELLWSAAILHDLGVVVDYHDHHKHSAYLVLNAGLPGFSHRELALVTLLVRSHRKALPEPGELAPLLADGDRERLLRLAACLRIAEQLDRGHTGVVRAVALARQGKAVRAQVTADGDATLQLTTASQELATFRAAFGRPLELGA